MTSFTDTDYLEKQTAVIVRLVAESFFCALKTADTKGREAEGIFRTELNTWRPHFWPVFSEQALSRENCLLAAAEEMISFCRKNHDAIDLIFESVSFLAQDGDYFFGALTQRQRELPSDAQKTLDTFLKRRKNHAVSIKGSSATSSEEDYDFIQINKDICSLMRAHPMPDLDVRTILDQRLSDMTQALEKIILLKRNSYTPATETHTDSVPIQNGDEVKLSSLSPDIISSRKHGRP